jgi:hypothetical protein
MQEHIDYFKSVAPGKGFIITELGSESSPGFGGENIEEGTELLQAISLVKKYAIALKEKVEVIEWFILDGGKGSQHDGFELCSLIEVDTSHNKIKKLSYYTYKFMSEKLEGSDWDNVQEIYNSSNVYVYKLIKNNVPIYIAWWDYWNEPSAKTKQVTITLNGISSTKAKITEAVPKYETGREVTNYASAFNSGVNSLSRSYTLTITLGKSPVYIEATTGLLSTYVPHEWNDAVQISPSGKTPATKGCGDGWCDKATELGSCPQDCLID